MGDRDATRLRTLTNRLYDRCLTRRSRATGGGSLATLFGVKCNLCIVASGSNGGSGKLVMGAMARIAGAPGHVTIAVGGRGCSRRIVGRANGVGVGYLSRRAPFSIFRRFKFRDNEGASGFNSDRILESSGKLIFLSEGVGSFVSLYIRRCISLSARNVFVYSISRTEIVSGGPAVACACCRRGIGPGPRARNGGNFIYGMYNCVCRNSALPSSVIYPLYGRNTTSFRRVGWGGGSIRGFGKFVFGIVLC